MSLRRSQVTGDVHAERPGMSAFALEEGVVYHTYSAFATQIATRGTFPVPSRTRNYSAHHSL
jgi:hypothetical protein